MSFFSVKVYIDISDKKKWKADCDNITILSSVKSSAIQISNGGSPSIYWSYSPLIVGFSHALIFLLTKLQKKKEYGGYLHSI